jgi:hypothetical protein
MTASTSLGRLIHPFRSIAYILVQRLSRCSKLALNQGCQAGLSYEQFQQLLFIIASTATPYLFSSSNVTLLPSAPSSRWYIICSNANGCLQLVTARRDVGKWASIWAALQSPRDQSSQFLFIVIGTRNGFSGRARVVAFFTICTTEYAGQVVEKLDSMNSSSGLTTPHRTILDNFRQAAQRPEAVFAGAIRISQGYLIICWGFLINPSLFSVESPGLPCQERDCAHLSSSVYYAVHIWVPVLSSAGKGKG